jgi:hypothetical protein
MLIKFFLKFVILNIVRTRRAALSSKGEIMPSIRIENLRKYFDYYILLPGMESCGERFSVCICASAVEYRYRQYSSAGGLGFVVV